MNFFKKIWNKLKEPKGIWLALFYILFVAVITGTIVLVSLVKRQTIFHFILYPISAILLTYFVYTIVYFAPKIKNSFIKTLRKYKFTSTMLDSYGYRTIVFSIFSFLINITYVVFMFIMSIISKSAWYTSITVYYLALVLMKGNVFYSKRKHNTDIKQARAYRFCGIWFIVLTVVFSGLITLIYTSNRYFEYAGLMIYVVASFTFYKLTLAIYNIFKASKQEDLYIQSIRNVNLVSALVSLMVLQVSLIQAFSPESQTSIGNALTGGAIALIMLVLGVFMIIKANKKLKVIENKEIYSEEQKKQ